MIVPLFFYGTLLDAGIRTRVLSRTLSPRSMTDAILFDHVREHVAGRAYPMLVRRQGCAVDGLLVRGLSPRDLDRLKAYEGPEYDLAPVTVQAGSRRIAAQAYMAAPGIMSDGRLWTLEHWRHSQT